MRLLHGTVIGILITLIALISWHYWKTYSANDEIAITEMGKVIVEKSIKGAKVLDVVLMPNYKQSVDYVYDKMYGLEVKYENNKKVKKITFPLSKYKNNWISPNNTQLFVLDKNAEVIHETK